MLSRPPNRVEFVISQYRCCRSGLAHRPGNPQNLSLFGTAVNKVADKDHFSFRMPENTFDLRIDELSKWVIVKDLENGGFGKSSVREAKELWIRFLNAAKQTQHTKAAELPWIFLRSLAIDINNEENSPLAAKAILEGLVRFARDVPPSEAVLDKINEDLRDVRRNIREKEVTEDKRIETWRIHPVVSRAC
jgi:hypothetical protein